jgi:hypothetical protein
MGTQATYCISALDRPRGAKKTQNGLVSRDTSPSIFAARIRSALTPLQNLVELAEGIEPPTL